MPAHTRRHALPTVAGSHGEYDLDPYAKLLSERVVFLGTPIDDTSANDIVAQLLCLESDDPDKDISLYINSPGGSVTAMMAIYDTMQFVCADLETVCLGQTGSAATILLAAGTPGKRLMLPHARLVIHQPTMDAGFGHTSDLHIQATEILRVRTVMENLLARHTGRSRKQVRADIDRDTILTSTEALAYQHHIKDFAAVARDTIDLGKTALLLVGKRPETFPALRLSTYNHRSRKWRVLRTWLLALSRLWAGTPDQMIRLMTWLERQRPDKVQGYYGKALDYFFWFGVQSALQENRRTGRSPSSLAALVGNE